MNLSAFVGPSCVVLFVLGFAVWQRAATLVQHGMLLALREINNDVEGAEQPLDDVPRWAQVGMLGGIVLWTRSYVRWLRGDLAACEYFATRAIRADRFAVRTLFSDVTTNARAVRALALAAARRFEEAMADVRAVEADASANLHARARAALAHALVLVHESDVPALRKHLGRTRNAIIQVVHPREVMLLRVLERHGRGLPQPYRAAPGEEGLATAHAWVQSVVPSLVAPTAAPERKRRSWDRPSPLPPPPSLLRSPIAKVLALWALLIAMFLSVWQLVSPDAPPTHQREVEATAASTESTEYLPYLLPGVFLSVFLPLFLVNIRTGVRGRRLLTQAQWEASTGCAQAGRVALEDLSANRQPVIAAQAHAHLATLALEEGDIVAAAARSRKSLRSLNQATRGKAAWIDLLQPSMLMEDAVVHALKGELATARERLESLLDRHPSAPVRRTAEFRVQLLIAVKSEDWERALELASARPLDLGLPLRDEILARLIVAVHGSTSPAETAFLREELDRAPGLRKYVAAAASSLLGAFRGEHAEAGSSEN